MVDLAKLVVKLEAQSSQLTAELQRAKKQVTRFDDDIARMAKRIGLGVTAAAAAATSGIGVLVKNSIDSADELSKLSQKVGIATDELSKLQYAAGLSGVESGSLQTALQRLSQSAVDAGHGTGEAAKAFNLLGVSAKNIDGTLKGNQALLLDLSDAFSRLPDGPTKTAAAIDILGRSGADLIPLLNGGAQGIRDMGAELQQLGGVVTPEAGRQAELFNDNLSRLKVAADGVANLVAKDLLSAFERSTGKLVNFAKEGDRVRVVADGITEAIKGVALAAAVVGESLAVTVRGVRAVAGSFEVVLADLELATAVAEKLNPIGALLGDSKDLGAALDERNAVLAKANQSYVELWTGNATAVSDALRASFAAQKEYVDQSKALIDSVTGFLPKQSADAATFPYRPGMGPTEVDAKAQREFNAEVDRGATVARRAAMAQSKYDEILELHRSLAEEDAGRQQVLNDKIAEAGRVFESTRTPLEQFNARLAELNVLRDTFVNGKPLLDTQTYTRAVVQAQDQLLGVSESVQKIADDADDAAKRMSIYADQAARNMQSAFADFLFDPFHDGLDGMLRDFANTLQRMAADLAAAEVFDWIKDSSSGGGIGELIEIGAGMLGFGMSKTGVKLRDSGGPGVAGDPYMIGTGAQPELFIPDTAGTFIPRDEWMKNAIPNITINVPIHAPRGSITEPTRMQVAASVGREVQRALARNG